MSCGIQHSRVGGGIGVGTIGMLVLTAILVGGIRAAAEEADDAPEADDATVTIDPDPKRWEARFALGGSVRAGDENRYSGNADATVRRFWESDTLTWRAVGDYGKTGGERDAENFGSSLEWRRDFEGRMFWLSGVSADHDAVQGRNLRLTAYSGPGYRIWEAAEKRYLDVSAGVGYRHERFRGDEPDNDLIDMRVGYEYLDVIGEVLEISHKSEALAPANELRNFLAKSELTLSVPLVGGLHFRNNARYEYVNEPADGREKSNFWLTIGLEYRL